MEILIVVFVVLFVLIALFKTARNTGRRPQARGLFTHKCRYCRDIIPDAARLCPNCLSPQSKPWWQTK
jgi:hypothetical protein